MGLTCANIHIFTGGVSASSTKPDVEHLLDEAARRLSYERVEDPSSSERQLATVVAPSWISVLDQNNPGVLTEDLTELAAQLSAVAPGPVLIASVYDSDEFVFLLYEDGKQVDGFATNDELVPFKFKKWSAKKRAEQWSRAFARPLDSAVLQEVTKPSGPFADDLLMRLCRLIEIPVEHGTLTSKDLETTSPGASYWHLRRQAGSADQDLGVTQAGDHKFLSAPWQLRFLVGESVPVIFEMSARTSALGNPVLEISGAAVDQGLVEVSEAEGLWHCGLDHIKAGGVQRVRAQLATAQTEGRRVIRASFPDLSPQALQTAPKLQISFPVTLALHGTGEGTGDLRASFLPRSSATDRLALKPEIVLEVVTPRWVPRGCPLNWGVRKLNTPAILSGVAIVEDHGEESIEHIRPLIERWLTGLEIKTPCQVKVAYEGQMNPESLNVPKRKTELALAEVGTDKKWLKPLQKPDALQSLFAQLIDEETSEPFAGAALQRAVTESPSRQTFHVCFWRRAASSSMQTLDPSRERLCQLIDSAFATLTGLQGWVAEWDWIPRFSRADDNDYSIYEDAHSLSRSVEHQFDARGGFMSREYCGRYLRGVSKQMWLGATLLAQVSRQRLAEVAHVTEIGSSVRLDVGADQSLSQLEGALAPVLPIPGK